MKLKKKITDHDHSNKYITTPEFNKLTSENFVARLKQANLAIKNGIANFVDKIDFDNKLLSFNKRIHSNKTKHVLVEYELNELSKKVKILSIFINIFSWVEFILQTMMDLKKRLFINQRLILWN